MNHLTAVESKKKKNYTRFVPISILLYPLSVIKFEGRYHYQSHNLRIFKWFIINSFSQQQQKKRFDDEW